ncbi:RING-H2 finger protein ATL5-like [Zingiber officinale]|uniref:RING-type domain-containing protein n=1 Tax=Zingiber officinale TaxID=94328 RepID=A0A8J5HNQ1_ZINOF|nr:RING-H2 finger protein ATL5-like [Zingiber officinale]KAG6532593.1 hypothetical protein ZIOFF_006442 [Zingiber officinale]
MPKASTCASASAMDGLPPPPPPPFVIVDPLPLAVDPNNFPPPASSSSSISLGSTLLIITAILGFSFVVCLFIRLGLRLRRSSALVAPAPVLSRTDPSDSAPEELTNKNNNNSAPIVSHLSLLELSSSLAAHSKSSPDCAVCLHSFLPDEHIRRLPTCSHAFHAECVDTWIRNSPSCPLCRAPVASPPLPPPSTAARHVKMTTTGSQGGSSVRGESRNLSLPPLLASPPRRRFYSTGSSIANLMEENVEAAMERIWEQSDYEASTSAYRGPSPQRNEIWAAMDSGGRRGSLMDSMDLSSRSPSFRSAESSFRHSIPSTDQDQEEASGGEGGPDFSRNWEAEEDLLSTVYQWIIGV